MSWVKDIDRDEERAGFLVTAKRKRIWNVALGLLHQLDTICQRHGLTYMAHHGTLLGAVRHQGFVPWDDDIDVVMTRPDFDALQKVAPREVRSPYFFQTIYTDPNYGMSIAKLRDSRTTGVQFPDMTPDMMNQGIFIDIYPMDCTHDGTEQTRENAIILGELWATICNPDGVRAAIEQDVPSYLSRDTLLRLLAAPKTQRMATLEAYCREHYHDSPHLTFLIETIYHRGPCLYNRRWFEDEPVWLPFEETKMPVPAEYYKVLRRRFGPDYHVFVPGASQHNNIILDPDVPYREFLKKWHREKGNRGDG